MKREDEEKAIHPIMLKMLVDLQGAERASSQDDARARVIDAYSPWMDAQYPLLTDETKILLENGDARRNSLAQEIREGLRVRGLWTPSRTSDLISAIFSAIDGVKDREKAILKTVESAIEVMDRLDSNQDEDPEAVCKDDQLRASVLWKALSPIRKAYKGDDRNGAMDL